jgi:hypothetical protein
MAYRIKDIGFIKKYIVHISISIIVPKSNARQINLYAEPSQCGIDEQRDFIFLVPVNESRL